MRNIVKYFITTGFLFFACSGLFAQKAVIRELSGTVELMRAGSTVWENAVHGGIITGDTIISTGFKSYALIGIENSLISVRPLTRLSFKEIAAAEGTETISVGLQAGRVKLDVSHRPGMKLSASVQTPMSTASTRGTIFEVNCFELWVFEGSIEYKGTSGSRVIVDSGGYSYIDERAGHAVYTKEMLLSSLKPAQPIAFDTYSSFTTDAAASDRKGAIDVGGIMDF